MYGEPLTMANQSAQARGYTRVTADIQASILAARDRLGATSYADIAEYTGLPERTVKYVLVDLPRLRRIQAGEGKTQGSLKERVMTAVKAIGPIKDVGELRRIVGMADTEHDVMHVLHSLHTQGRIDFTERGNGMGKATVVDIHVPKKGAKRVDRETYEALPETVRDRLPEAVQPDGERIDANLDRMRDRLRDPERAVAVGLEQMEAGSEATTEAAPQSTTPPSAPGPEREGYPLLDALLERERTRLDGDSKGMAFVVAAEAIQDIDPDTARTLMEKAKAYDVPFPSPIEQEYIRYVAEHSPLVERPDGS
jgi:alkylated DNA nucleotide flippase Atl1